MKSLIDKGISTIRNDGVKVFAMRTWKYGLVKLKRLTRPNDVKNIEKWKQLKNKYKGKRIFIIGNGPSLNKMPLYLLEGEYTISFNRFNLMFERLNWLPNFYMVTDDLVIKDMYSQINQEILPLVEYAFFPDIHPSNVEFSKYISHRDNVHWLNMDQPQFRADLPYCGINKTVVNGAIQVVAYMGFTEIYLIGVDMTFADQKVKKLNSRNWEAAEKDPNHFDPRYFGKGLKYHNPTVHEMLEKFEEGREFFANRGVKIFNAGYGGKLEVFPRVDFDSLFDLNDIQIQALLNTSRVLKERNITFYEALNSPLITEPTETYPNVFKASGEFGIKLIPLLIFDYLPVGPYKGEYFFVKR